MTQRRTERRRQPGSRRRKQAERQDGRFAGPAPVSVGDVLEVSVLRQGFRGEGVAQYEGFTIFVPGALPQERARVRVERVQSSYASAAIEAIPEPVAGRIEPRCDVFGRCGGCQLQHMTYGAQLQLKKQVLTDALIRIGKFDADLVRAVVADTRGMDDPWRYRNKVHVVAAAREGRFVSGFVEEGTHEPVEAAICHIRPTEHDILLRVVTDILAELHVQPYDEKRRTGHVRNIGIRTTRNGEAMVIITTADHRLPLAHEFAERVDNRTPRHVKLAGVVQVATGVAGDPANVGKQRVLFGRGFLHEEILGMRFRVSPTSFLQVNSRQADVLYNLALDFSEVRETDTVFDLYSGVGTLSLVFARRARSVHGIESSPSAVADAQENARANGIHNVEFHVGAAEREVDKLLNSGLTPDIVVLDPPRAGVDRRVLLALRNARPRRIIYLSCDPATLARDLRMLADYDYQLDAAVPVDMFPQTAHVECCISTYRVD